MKGCGEMKKLWAGVLALLLFPVPLLPQPVGPLKTVRVVVENWDLDATTYTYPLTSPAIMGPGQRAVTSGASTTVTNCALCTAPFAGVAVGDVIIFFVNDTQVYRYVTAKASDISITVDTAIDLSTNGTVGYSFVYRTVTIGTGATNGWFQVGGGGISSAVTYQIDQLNATGGVDVRIECRMSSSASGLSAPISVFERNVTTAGIGTAASTGRTTVEILPHFTDCRVGMKFGSADDGTDTGAAAEVINIYVNTY
jgi:hypothetical protein